MDKHKLIDDGWKKVNKMHNMREQIKDRKVELLLQDVEVYLSHLLYYLEDPMNGEK